MHFHSVFIKKATFLHIITEMIEPWNLKPHHKYLYVKCMLIENLRLK